VLVTLVIHYTCRLTYRGHYLTKYLTTPSIKPSESANYAATLVLDCSLYVCRILYFSRTSHLQTGMGRLFVRRHQITHCFTSI